MEEVPGKVFTGEAIRADRFDRLYADQQHDLDELRKDVAERKLAGERLARQREYAREKEKFEEMRRLKGYVDNKVSRQWGLDEGKKPKWALEDGPKPEDGHNAGDYWEEEEGSPSDR